MRYAVSMRYAVIALGLLCSLVASEVAAQDYFAKPKRDVEVSVTPATLRFSAPAVGEEKKIALTVLTQKHCVPCKPYVRSLGDTYALNVVDIADEEAMKQVRREYPGLADLVTPLTLFKDENGKEWQVSGRVSPDSLAETLSRLHAANVSVPSGAATGVGGEFHGNGMIQSMLSQWAKYIGEGRELSFKWDRTGQQRIDLLHGEKWTVQQFAGKYGHCSIAGDISRLPVKAIGCGYRIGDDGLLTLDLDPVQIRLAEREPAAYGIDPITIGASLYSLGSALYQLLNPEVDLLLGGNIECTAWLAENQLHFKFASAPGIRVKAWFEWQLEVSDVVIGEHNIHVGFKPQPRSWFQVHSRDFPVLSRCSHRDKPFLRALSC